jgi:hypothetical protein
VGVGGFEGGVVGVWCGGFGAEEGFPGGEGGGVDGGGVGEEGYCDVVVVVVGWWRGLRGLCRRLWRVCVGRLDGRHGEGLLFLFLFAVSFSSSSFFFCFFLIRVQCYWDTYMYIKALLFTGDWSFAEILGSADSTWMWQRG